MKAVIGTGRALADALAILVRHPSAALYPMSCLVAIAILTFTVVLPLLEAAVGSRPLLFGAVYLAYGALYFLISFSHVALLTSLAEELDGRSPAIVAGLARAATRLPWIAVHAIVLATLGLVVFVLRIVVNPVFAVLILPAIGKRAWERWQSLSYSVPLLMAVPVIALDEPPAKNVFARGDRLVRDTWGNHARPAHDTGVATIALLLFTVVLAVPLLRQGLAEHDPARVRVGLAAILVATSVTLQVTSLMNALFALAAYRYAVAGQRDVYAGDPTYGEHAFVRHGRALESAA